MDASYRSKSYSGGRMQIEPYYNNSGSNPSSRPPNDFRSYSVSYTSSSSSSSSNPASYYYNAASAATEKTTVPPQKLKKWKSTNGSISRSWTFNDAEFQRKRRVASYKAYTVEGKVKGSVRKSFRWIKDRYTQVFNGWW